MLQRNLIPDSWFGFVKDAKHTVQDSLFLVLKHSCYTNFAMML